MVKGITIKEVESAAEKILSEGKNPTIEKIRQELGTGSNSTISKYLQEWRANRLIASTQDLPAPNNPPDTVHAAVNQVWEKIKDETAAQIKAIQEKSDAAILASLATRDDAILERNKLQDSLKLCESRLNQVSADKEIALLDLKSLQQKHTILQQSYEQLEKFYNELKQQTEENIVLLNARNEALKITHQEEIARLTSVHEKSFQQLIKDNNTYMQDKMVQIDQLKTSEKKSQQRIDELIRSIQNDKIELTAFKTELFLTKKERDMILLECSKKDDLIQFYKQQLEKYIADIFSEIKVIKENDRTIEMNEQFSYLKDSINDISYMSKVVLDLIKIKDSMSIADENSL